MLVYAHNVKYVWSFSHTLHLVGKKDVTIVLKYIVYMLFWIKTINMAYHVLYMVQVDM